MLSLQVEFVGYLQNPCFRRGKLRADVVRETVALRNARLRPRPTKDDENALRAARTRKRLAEGV